MDLTDKILNTLPDCEIVTTRTVNGSAEKVFKAWTDPAHLKNWWGPKGFSNTFHEFDLRPGGKWVFTMHGPDKGNYSNEVVFIKIEEPLRLVWNRISKPHFLVVVVFDELSNDTTTVTFKMIFNSPEECSKLRGFVVDKNEENFDRLEAELLLM